MPVKSRETRWIVGPEGECLFSVRNTEIEILDEGGGEFVAIKKQKNSNPLRITPEEWTELKAAIDYAIAECRPAKKKNAGDL